MHQQPWFIAMHLWMWVLMYAHENTNYYSFWLFHVGFSDRFEVSAWHQLRRKKVSNSCLLIEVQWAITSGNVIQAELVLKTFCFSGYCCILGWISLFKLGLQNLTLKNGFCKQFYKPNMKTRYGNRLRECSQGQLQLAVLVLACERIHREGLKISSQTGLQTGYLNKIHK